MRRQWNRSLRSRLPARLTRCAKLHARKRRRSELRLPGRMYTSCWLDLWPLVYTRWKMSKRASFYSFLGVPTRHSRRAEIRGIVGISTSYSVVIRLPPSRSCSNTYTRSRHEVYTPVERVLLQSV